ncbi:hypothetical protein NDU88_001510 [Pleurodeles waltl]|uniref:Uncharacterized protein n=1 Tax=Pleurodeles waltl TaxID=8319 RepID=A0AAV7SZQ6_PLEWA|nr:hypothetical protein NDU88_001510 [Pleurodeles waltl]
MRKRMRRKLDPKNGVCPKKFLETETVSVVQLGFPINVVNVYEEMQCTEEQELVMAVVEGYLNLEIFCNNLPGFDEDQLLKLLALASQLLVFNLTEDVTLCLKKVASSDSLADDVAVDCSNELIVEIVVSGLFNTVDAEDLNNVFVAVDVVAIIIDDIFVNCFFIALCFVDAFL